MVILLTIAYSDDGLFVMGIPKNYGHLWSKFLVNIQSLSFSWGSGKNENQH